MPPIIFRVATWLNFIRRGVIPVRFIRFPAKIKNGTARNEIDCVCAITLWTAILIGMSPVVRNHTIPDQMCIRDRARDNAL